MSMSRIVLFGSMATRLNKYCYYYHQSCPWVGLTGPRVGLGSVGLGWLEIFSQDKTRIKYVKSFHICAQTWSQLLASHVRLC